MTKIIKMGILWLCVIAVFFSQSYSVSAVRIENDDEGNTYLFFGGYMCSDLHEEVKHSLNPVNCYIDFDIDENRSLWMAAYGAIQDWDWHLSYISQYQSTQQGYNRDIYGFSMDCNQVTRENADIRIKYTDGFIVDECGGTYPGAYGFTTPYNCLNQVIRESVNSGGNWRYADVLISQKKINDYSLSHTEEETEQLMRRVINHEIGHALGLAHDPRDNGIIMYGQLLEEPFDEYIYDWDSMTATVPTLHDLMGVYLLYS